MKLRRFKVEKERIQGREAVIEDPGQMGHIRRVLRLKAGDPLILFDGEGKECHAVLSSLSSRRITLTLLKEPSPVTSESPLRVILGLGLLKSSKFDWVIQKVTELGVSEIVPFYSFRVVPRWEESKARAKQSRWDKIASEAAKQCRRARIPRIHPLCSFEETLAMDFAGAGKIFLWEEERAGTLKDALADAASVIYALVGPEGGFSENEALRAREAGFFPIRLGPRILRAETAGIVIVSLLQFFLGDLN